VLLRLSYLALTGMVTLLRLLAMSNTDKDIEILVLRHQLAVPQRRVDKPRLTSADRAFLAILLHMIPRPTLRRLHLIVSPDTILHWHRDLLPRHHARVSRPKQPGRRPTIRSIRALVLRLARDNPSWGYRRIHGELATLGITVAPSTVGEILTTNNIQPAPHRDHLTWATFLRSQTHALLAADFFDTNTLTGARLSVLVIIEHATRRIRILGATPTPHRSLDHPNSKKPGQGPTGRPHHRDIPDPGPRQQVQRRFRCRSADNGTAIITTGIRVPRMNAIIKRWIRTCRAELLDRTLILNQAHLLHVLREFEAFYHDHRTHRALQSAAPHRPLPPPIIESNRLDHLTIQRRDRLGGILNESHHAA
jgi:putative transposase